MNKIEMEYAPKYMQKHLITGLPNKQIKPPRTTKDFLSLDTIK